VEGGLMADEGLTLEAWSLPHVGTFAKRLNITKLVESYTFNDRFNDLCDGVFTIPDDAALPSGVLVKDKLLKVDEANHANDVGSVIRVLRGGTPIIHQIVTRMDDSWSDQDPTTKFSTEGLEWLLDRATVPHYDHPADPTQEPDWIYGADSVLVNTDFEASGITSETVQLVVIATAGTFKIGVDYPVGAGFVYTANIVWNAGASDIAVALEALADIDDAFVTGAGTETNPFIIEVLAPASVDMGWATDSALLTGTASIITITSGGILSTDPWTRSQNPITGVFHGSYTTFEISTEQARTGTYSLKVNGDPPAFPGAFPGAQQLLSVTPGRTFRASVWVRPTQTGPFRFVIRTRDETFIAQSEATLTANTWTQMTIASVVIPLWVNQIIFRVATISNGDEPAWYVDDALFAPGQAADTYGAIMNDIRTAAIAVGSPLSWLTPTWTDANDSDGVAWDRTLKWNVNHDQTFLQLVEYARRWNYEHRIRWDVADARFEWDLWNPSGGGQTRANIAITGKSGVSSSGPIVKRPPDFTYMRVEGEDGRWGDYVSTTLDDVWGRLEKAQLDRQGVESAELDQFAQRMVTRGQDKTASRSVQVEDPSILPWTAYEPGDTVWLNLAPKDTKKQLRIAACLVEMSPNRATPRYEVHFVSPVLSQRAAEVQGLRFLLRELKRPQVRATREAIVNPVIPTLEITAGRSWVILIAASDSRPELISIADFICDGTNDEVQWLAAWDLIKDTGGIVVPAAGNYNFGATCNLAGTMGGGVTFLSDGGAVIHATSSIGVTGAFSGKWLFYVTAAHGAATDTTTLIFDGIAFDGANVTDSSTFLIVPAGVAPHYKVLNSIFTRFDARFFNANGGSFRSFEIAGCVFPGNSCDGGAVEAPDMALIQFNSGTPNYAVDIHDNFFYNITFNAATFAAIIDIDQASGQVGSIHDNNFGSCDEPIYTVNTRSAAYHNWINLTFEAGSHGGAIAGVANTLNVATTAVGNVGTGEDDLASFTVPAATLAVNGDRLEFEAAGTFAATANNKRIRVKFGATTIFDTGVLAITSASDWQISGTIVRTGAATQKCVVTWECSDTSLNPVPDYTTAAETLSGTVILKLTGEATANNDIVQEIMVTQVVPV
jgi:hypothetical protein